MGFYPYRKNSENQTGRQSSARAKESGQIVIEYVLILVVVVAIASILVRYMVRRGPTPDQAGFVVKGWAQLVNEIAADPADEVASNE